MVGTDICSGRTESNVVCVVMEWLGGCLGYGEGGDDKDVLGLLELIPFLVAIYKVRESVSPAFRLRRGYVLMVSGEFSPVTLPSARIISVAPLGEPSGRVRTTFPAVGEVTITGRPAFDGFRKLVCFVEEVGEFMLGCLRVDLKFLLRRNKFKEGFGIHF